MEEGPTHFEQRLWNLAFNVEHYHSNTEYVNLCSVQCMHDIRKTMRNKDQNKESCKELAQVNTALLIYTATGQALDLIFQQIAGTRCRHVI